MRGVLAFVFGIISCTPTRSSTSYPMPSTHGSIDVAVLGTREPVRIGSQQVIAYDLMVRNTEDDPIALVAVDYEAGDFGHARIETAKLAERANLLWEGDAAGTNDLLAFIKAQGPTTMPDQIVPAHRSAAVHMWLAAANDARIPRIVQNRLLVKTRTGTRQLSVDLTVAVSAPLVLEAPLRGGPWTTWNGYADLAAHVRRLIPIHGKQWGAQRFAADFVRIGPDGRILPKGLPLSQTDKF